MPYRILHAVLALAGFVVLYLWFLAWQVPGAPVLLIATTQEQAAPRPDPRIQDAPNPGPIMRILGGGRIYVGIGGGMHACDLTPERAALRSAVSLPGSRFLVFVTTPESRQARSNKSLSLDICNSTPWMRPL